MALDEDYTGNERRKTPHLTQEQVDIIAERAAEVALEKVYTHIGRSVVSRFFWVVGAITLAVAAWLNGAGKFPGS